MSKQLAQGHYPVELMAWWKCKPRTARPQRQRI